MAFTSMKTKAAFALMLPLTALASAEVMDKEPPISLIWSFAIPGAALALILTRAHPLLGLIALVPLLPVLGMVEECHEPTVGPAILREAGQSYVVQVHLALALAVVAYAAGYSLWRRDRSKKSIGTNPEPGLNPDN